VYGSAASETKEETARKVRAGDVGAPTTPGGLAAPTERRVFIICILLCVILWKIWLMIVYLDRLAPFVGTARDERP
jgi:hypothetical protein